MYALTTTEHSGQYVADSQVVVVVCMEIEMQGRVALLHLAHELNDL